MLGCAAIFGAVMWLVLFLVFYFSTDAGFWTSVGTSAILGSIFFFAVLVVGLLDWLRHFFWRSAVRRRLLRRRALSDDVAMEGVAEEQRPNLLETRRAVAEFFDVPADRLLPDDRLDRDYNYRAFEPWLHWHVFTRTSAAREFQGEIWTFDSSGLRTLEDLSRGIQLSLIEKTSQEPPPSA